jgi:hypothetical protein
MLVPPSPEDVHAKIVRRRAELAEEERQRRQALLMVGVGLTTCLGLVSAAVYLYLRL